MRKPIRLLLLAIFILAGWSHSYGGRVALAQTSAMVEVAGPITWNKKATTTITCKGFQPGQEVNVLFTAKDGVQSDVGYALKPAPRADDSGAWSTKWSCGRFIEIKMVEAGGSYKLVVTDNNYVPIAHTFVTFTK